MAASVGYHSPNPPDGREAPALQAFPRLCGRGRAGPLCASTSLGAGRPSRRARSGPEPSEGFSAAGRGAAVSGRELRQVLTRCPAGPAGRSLSARLSREVFPDPGNVADPEAAGDSAADRLRPHWPPSLARRTRMPLSRGSAAASGAVKRAGLGSRKPRATATSPPDGRISC